MTLSDSLQHTIFQIFEFTAIEVFQKNHKMIKVTLCAL